MHIAFWSPAWPMEKFQNGIITYVHWMKRELQSQGHRVSVFTEGSNSGQEADVHYIRLRLKDRIIQRIARLLRPSEYDVFGYSAVIAAEIMRVHRREPIDIIEMEESFGWFADVAKRTSLPLLVKLHGPAFLSLVEDELHTPFGQVKVDREGSALRLAGAIVSPSQLTLEQTLTKYQLAPRETGHIVNPLRMDSDTPLWSLPACERDTILFVGRFDLRKGADVLLQALLLVLQKRPAVKLIFVGPDRGLPGSRGELVHFETYCDSLFPVHLRTRVDYRGRLANREIATLRTQAMLTVIASRWENQGYTVLEAMFQGCPIVSTDAGGCPESIINGVTGRLAKSEDPEDFAAQILAMLDDPERARLLGQAARQHVIDLHSPDKVAASSLLMYQKVIARRGN